MASKKYKILWIDDEWDTMKAFQQECEVLYGLELVPFRTRKEGMDALERDLKSWDGVILDAKMFDESDNEVAKLTGLRKAKQRLDELSIKRAIPYFIATGQPDLISDEIFEESFGKYYIKGKDDVKLMEDLLTAVQSSEKSQIRKLYQDVFQAIEHLALGNQASSILENILLPMHYPEKYRDFEPSKHYNQLRQLLEYVFRACNKVGLIPDECMNNGTVNLSQSTIYLSGKDANIVGVRYGDKFNKDRIVPPYIEHILRYTIDLGNIHSHSTEMKEVDHSTEEKIMVTSNSRYMIFGLALQICETILWFDQYIAQHNDKEINLFLCNKLTKEQKDQENG
ncbi:MAG: hypothetical protein K6E54_03990 [Bacteroidaceae bacterium]|nr:hypothetical protein [Bacteroidaceae bacterium]